MSHHQMVASKPPARRIPATTLKSTPGLEFISAHIWEGVRQSELLEQTFDFLGETGDLRKHDRATLRLHRAHALEAALSVRDHAQELER